MSKRNGNLLENTSQKTREETINDNEKLKKTNSQMLLAITLLLALAFASLSFFQVYSYVLEPIGLHHFIAFLFPEWFETFNYLYRKYQPDRADEYIIMLIWAKFLGVITGVVMCLFVFYKKMDVQIFSKKAIKRKKWVQVLSVIYLISAFVIGLIYSIINSTRDKAHLSSFYAAKLLTNQGFFTYAFYFFGCAASITSLFLLMIFIKKHLLKDNKTKLASN